MIHAMATNTGGDFQSCFKNTLSFRNEISNRIATTATTSADTCKTNQQSNIIR